MSEKKCELCYRILFLCKMKVMPKEIEAKEGIIISEIDTISPDPAWLDYIYQTDEYLDEDGNVDVDSLLRKVYSYKPISL